MGTLYWPMCRWSPCQWNRSFCQGCREDWCDDQGQTINLTWLSKISKKKNFENFHKTHNFKILVIFQIIPTLPSILWLNFIFGAFSEFFKHDVFTNYDVILKNILTLIAKLCPYPTAQFTNVIVTSIVFSPRSSLHSSTVQTLIEMKLF